MVKQHKENNNRSVIVFNNDKKNKFDTSVQMVLITENDSGDLILNKNFIFRKSFIRSKIKTIERYQKFKYSFSL